MSRKNNTPSKINTDLKEAIKKFKRIKYDSSKDLLYKVLESDPINPEAHYYLGLIYSKEENWQKAIVHLKTIIDLGINFIFTNQCRMLLGLIYFKNKEFTRALKEFTDALESEEETGKIYAALSCVYHYMNEKEKAFNYAKQAFDIDPYNLNAKNTYGFLLSDYNINITKSIEILREVVRLKPDNPAYLDSLGWAYYKKGDYKAAKASLEEAFKYANDNIEIKNHLETINKFKNS
ncbi:MAG: tetratricopeptide repeat protein [Spirochaetes bacterium]|nr:tetratricopeptide repeat protein [Spirochaetota bacterium]